MSSFTREESSFDELLKYGLRVSYSETDESLKIEYLNTLLQYHDWVQDDSYTETNYITFYFVANHVFTFQKEDYVFEPEPAIDYVDIEEDGWYFISNVPGPDSLLKNLLKQ